MITVFSTDKPIDHIELYRAFIDRETDGSGTVVLHHGRVKRPGKKLPDFSFVELRSLVADADADLARIASQAVELFALNQALIVHRLGVLAAGDTVLLAVVSAATRNLGFAACSWIVDEVKKEDFIELVERPKGEAPLR